MSGLSQSGKFPGWRLQAGRLMSHIVALEAGTSIVSELSVELLLVELVPHWGSVLRKVVSQVGLAEAACKA